MRYQASRQGRAAALALLLSAWCIPAQTAPATVLFVGDGDTLTVSEVGRRVTIRLACIDAPETAQPPYGAKARAALQSLTPAGKSVSIQGSKKDRYGRTVAEVFRAGTNVNLELVSRGEAFVYRQYLSGCDRNAYLSAEKSAESARLGIWSATGSITRPWDWRRGGISRTGGAQQPTEAPSSSRHRCRDIGSWSKAQEFLKQGHHYLDGDGDGEACDSLR